MFAVKNVAPKRPAPAFVAMALPQTKAIDRHGFRDASPGGCARFVDVRSRHAETAHSLEMDLEVLVRRSSYLGRC
jgi:hypothetical protein